MAATANGYTTGIDRQSGDLRQRGAPEVELNGRTVLPRLDEEDKKKLQVSPMSSTMRRAKLTRRPTAEEVEWHCPVLR